MNKLLHYGKHVVRKTAISMRRTNEKNLRTLISEKELKSLALCRGFIRDGDYILQIDPLTGERFATNRTGISFIIKQEDGIYSIDFFGETVLNVPICEHSYMSICQVFNAHASQARAVLKAKMHATSANAFDLMYNTYFDDKKI